MPEVTDEGSTGSPPHEYSDALEQVERTAKPGTEGDNPRRHADRYADCANRGHSRPLATRPTAKMSAAISSAPTT